MLLSEEIATIYAKAAPKIQPGHVLVGRDGDMLFPPTRGQHGDHMSLVREGREVVYIFKDGGRGYCHPPTLPRRDEFNDHERLYEDAGIPELKTRIGEILDEGALMEVPDTVVVHVKGDEVLRKYVEGGGGMPGVVNIHSGKNDEELSFNVAFTARGMDTVTWLMGEKASGKGEYSCHSMGDWEEICLEEENRRRAENESKRWEKIKKAGEGDEWAAEGGWVTAYCGNDEQYSEEGDRVILIWGHWSVGSAIGYANAHYPQGETVAIVVCQDPKVQKRQLGDRAVIL